MRYLIVAVTICCMAMAGTNTGGKVELTQTARDGIQIDASYVLSGQINYSQVNEQQSGSSGGTNIAGANVQPDQRNVRAVHQEELLYCSWTSTTTTVACNGQQYIGCVEVKNSDQNIVYFSSSGQVLANQNYFADTGIKQTDNSVCVYRI